MAEPERERGGWKGEREGGEERRERERGGVEGRERRGRGEERRERERGREKTDCQIDRQTDRLRQRQRMDEQTLFYEGSEEDSRSFYIQPSPIRETREREREREQLHIDT